MDQLRDLAEEAVLAEAMAADVAVLYKHSHKCPTSALAMNEVRWFVDERPDVPVYVVNVVRNRELAQQLADDLNISHKSPQVILLRSGQPQADASHHKITCELLKRWVNQAA